MISVLLYGVKGTAGEWILYWNHGNDNFAVEPPEDQNWAEWFEARLKGYEPIPVFVCDGKTVWENSNPLPGARPQWKVSPHTGPQDLMSGEGRGSLPVSPNVKIASLLFPDLSPKIGWGFEFDPQPADGRGCVLLKRSARLATKEPLGWARMVLRRSGEAVMRWCAPSYSTCRPNRHSDPKRARTRADDPDGRLSANEAGLLVSHCNSQHHARQHHPSGDKTTRARTNPRSSRWKTTIRYHFDFAADLPDSLFTIEDARAAQ